MVEAISFLSCLNCLFASQHQPYFFLSLSCNFNHFTFLTLLGTDGSADLVLFLHILTRTFQAVSMFCFAVFLSEFSSVSYFLTSVQGPVTFSQMHDSVNIVAFGRCFSVSPFQSWFLLHPCPKGHRRHIPGPFLPHPSAFPVSHTFQRLLLPPRLLFIAPLNEKAVQFLPPHL